MRARTPPARACSRSRTRTRSRATRRSRRSSSARRSTPTRDRRARRGHVRRRRRDRPRRRGRAGDRLRRTAHGRGLRLAVPRNFAGGTPFHRHEAHRNPDRRAAAGAPPHGGPRRLPRPQRGDRLWLEPRRSAGRRAHALCGRHLARQTWPRKTADRERLRGDRSRGRLSATDEMHHDVLRQPGVLPGRNTACVRQRFLHRNRRRRLGCHVPAYRPRRRRWRAGLLAERHAAGVLDRHRRVGCKRHPAIDLGDGRRRQRGATGIASRVEPDVVAPERHRVRPLRRDLVVRPNGNSLRRVTGGGGFAPTWSPDGRQIAFSRHGSIFVVEPAAHRLRRVVQGASAVDLAWSPDGRRLAIRTFRHGLQTVALDGSHLRSLVSEDLGELLSFGTRGIDWQPLS